MHKETALSVLNAIKANPSLTAQQAVAIVEAKFPGNGQKYLGWYGEWWYKFGVTDAATWAGLKARVAGMGEEHYQLAKGKMARMVAELAVRRIQIQGHKAIIDAIEAEIAEIQPKTEPDEETLEFFNIMGPDASRLVNLQNRLIQLTQEMEEYEDRWQ